MRISTLSVVVFFWTMPVTAFGQGISADNEWARIDGEWEIVSAIYSGVADEVDVGDVIRFGENAASWFTKGKGVGPKVHIALDPARSPKRMDWVWSPTPTLERKAVMRGIYEIKGGVLRICGVIGDTIQLPVRPTEFKSPKGSKVWVWQLSRRAAKPE